MKTVTILIKKHNDNTFSRDGYDKEKGKFVDSVKNTNNNKKKTKVVNSMNNRTLSIGFSNCRKAYLMNHILLQKQEPIFVVTKSLNQYPNTNTQASDENQPLQDYENSAVVFDVMLPSKQESHIDLSSTRGRHNNIDIYYMSQSYFHLPKNTIRNISEINILFKQTLRDIILFFHVIAGLNMNLEE